MNGQKKPKSNWLSFALIILLFVAMNVFAAIYMPRPQSMVPTSYSTDPGGAKALFLLLNKSGFRSERLLKNYRGIPKKANILVVLEPTELITKREARQLKRWVAEGHIFVAGATCRSGFQDALGFRTVCAPPGKSVVIRNIHSPGALRGVRSLGPVEPMGLQSPPPEAIPLVLRHGKAVVALMRWKHGRVYIVNSPELFANEKIAKNDNARLIYNIFGKYRGKRNVYFDEYHHGYSESGKQPTSSIMELVFKTTVGLFSLTLMLAFMLLLLNRDGIRTTPAGAEVRAASPLEFSGALAMLYHRAGAHAQAVASMLAVLRREMTRRRGIDPDTPFEAMPGVASDSSEERALRKFAALENTLKEGGRMSPNDAMDATCEIEKFRREMMDKYHE